MNPKVVIVIFIIAITVGFIIAIKESIKAQKEIKRLERINNNYATGAIKVEENIKNANEQKKTLNTGNNADNVNNATDIMRNISNKRSKG